MGRKKEAITVVDAVYPFAPTFLPKHGTTLGPATGLANQVDSMIDLDLQPIQAKTEYHVPNHVGETVALQLGQKAKRKYTKRAKTVSKAVAPTFVDRDAIRKARIQLFTNYIDGIATFDEVSKRDDQFRQFDELAAELQNK